MHADYLRFIAGIQEYVRDPQVIVDVGAFDGAGACDVKTAFPHAAVYAIDPLHLDITACNAGGVIPIVGAVADEYSVRDFTRSKQRGLTSMHSRGIDEDGSFRAVTFPLKWNIDALKIDVEGAAAEVLDGSSPLPTLIQVETEVEELFAGQVVESVVFSWLKERGYRMVWEDRAGAQTESQWVR
jgi:hypothetical protein